MWNFSKYIDKCAIIDEFGTSMSYGELEQEGIELSAAIGKRCLVFSLCSNTIGSVLGYATFINHKIVAALLNAQLEKELLFNLIGTYQPEYLWVPNEKRELFPTYTVCLEKYEYCLLKTDISEGFPLYEELGLLLTTSGSTGSPKFVRQSYKNIQANAEAIAEYLLLDDTERPITTLPMNYTYGLSIINSHFLVGATLLVTDKSILQKEFWNFFKEQEATSFGGVPYTYEILDKMRFMRMKLPSLRTMTQAGGKLSPELHKKFAEWSMQEGKNFIVMYGQCEATARMAYLPSKKSLEKYGSMGIAIPGGKFHIIDVEGKQICEPEISGELVYEGPNVTLGYAEQGEDLSKGDERHGILQTGDMAKFDADGYYYIVGRKKRFLKIYGNRVNLDEIDRMIKANFDYIDCASAGIDDHMYIFVTDTSIAEKVKEFVVNKTGLNQLAFKVVALDEIPKNDSGKTLYRELEKYYK